MNRIWKRVAASALVVCLFLTQLPLVLFANASQQEETVYNFCLEQTNLEISDGVGFAEKSLSNSSSNAQSAIGRYYTDRTLNWKFFANTSSAAIFGSDSTWKGIRINNNKDDAEYLALTLRSPGTGKFCLTLSYASDVASQVYILPGTTTTGSLATAIENAQPIMNLAASKEDRVATAEYAFEKDSTYILVFKQTENGRTYLYSMGARDAAQITSDTTIYDLDLLNNGLISGMSTVDSVKSLISNRYETTGWKWEDENITDNTLAKFTSAGLRLLITETEWVALRIKAPGSGLYSVGLQYSTSYNGGVGAIYVLPGNTTDIQSALCADNRVGKVDFNAGATSNDFVTSEIASCVGTCQLQANKEYIVVFEAYQKSEYNASRAYMAISKLLLTPGEMEISAQENKVSPVAVDDDPVSILEGCLHGTSVQVNGDDYLFMPVEGGKVVVFNMDKRVREYDIDVPFVAVDGIAVDEDGKIWMSGSSKVLFCFDPVTRTGRQIKSFESVAGGATNGFDMVYADGCVYFGTYPAGYVIKYDIAADTYTQLYAHSDASYVRGMAYKDGYLYAGLYGDANKDGVKTSAVVKMDPANGNVLGAVDTGDKMNSVFYTAGFAGDLLLMGGEKNQEKLVAINTKTMQLYNIAGAPESGGIYQGITEEVDGKVYFVLKDHGLCSLTVDTYQLETNIISTVRPVRCGATSIIQVDDPAYPGDNIVLYAAINGTPMLYNLQTGKIGTFSKLVEGYSVPTQLHSMIAGSAGSGNIYMGAYNTGVFAQYNVNTGITTTINTDGQTDAICEYEGVLYTGNYNNGSITRINADGSYTVLLSLNDDVYDQSRIHTLTAGGGKVFAGSVPDSYGYGGCLAWVDVKTGQTYVEKNVVKNQSINKLIYDEESGLLYGSTTTYGGNAVGMKAGESAVLFVYDVANEEKIAEFDLRNYLSGFTKIDYIAGIEADPNEKGLFWGVVSETLFTFRYNTASKTLTVKEVLSYARDTFETGSNRKWSPRPICFDGKGNVYVSFSTAGGMRRINMKNPSDNERLPVHVPTYYTLGDDGNLYYAYAEKLMMYPLNVTDKQWAQAETVDQLIASIGTMITLESEQQIQVARAAYEALSPTEKALVQQIDLLQQIETQLLDLKIAALPGKITHEHKSLLDGLWDHYVATSEQQRRYLKNFNKLVAAINAEASYVELPSYQVGQEEFFTLEDAILAADAQENPILLLQDVEVEELLLTDGIILDLNGKIMTAGAFRANIPGLSGGYVIDSSLGNEGLLQIAREEDLFLTDNPDLPVYDAQHAGYRFFDYNLEVHGTTTNMGQGKEKFWFKFHFYTDDTCQQQDMDAYQLIEADGSNLTISVDVMWRDNLSKQVYFGLPNGDGDNSTELFSQAWATDATLSRWLYLTIGGIHKQGEGTLEVTPTITANGVQVQNGSIRYTQGKPLLDYGWSDGII